MSAKFILPTIAISIGLVQVLVPHLSRSATLLGYRRDEAYLTSPTYTSTFDQLCKVQHADKFYGCEDMNLVNLNDGSTVIFTACLSDYANRKRVLSGERIQDTASRIESGDTVPADKIYRWDLDSDEVVELELQGMPGGDNGGDRGFHGMDVNQLPDGSLSIYVINHRLNGSVVEKFSHNPKTTSLTHIVTIPTADGGLKTPNDIYAIPHLDDINAFYITDEHRHMGGVLRTIEDWTRRPWTNVHYHSTSGWRVALSGIAGVNGITGDNKAGGRVYVVSLLNGEIIVADQDEKNPGVLKELQRIPTSFMGDNPTLTSSGADIFIAGYTRPQNHATHLETQGGPVPGSIVARISTKQLGSAFFGEEGGYTSTPTVEDLFVDIQGRWINSSSTAVYRERAVPEDKVEVDVDEESSTEEEEGGVAKALGDLYITGLFDRGILKCRDI